MRDFHKSDQMRMVHPLSTYLGCDSIKRGKEKNKSLEVQSGPTAPLTHHHSTVIVSISVVHLASLSEYLTIKVVGPVSYIRPLPK